MLMGEAAEMLGLSRAGLRYLIAKGRVACTVRDGVHYFDRATIAKLALDKNARKQANSSTTPGALAAHVFAQLDAGRSPVALVQDLKITPATMRELVEQYTELRALEPMRAKTHAACARCGEHAARFCGTCVEATKPRPREAPESSQTSQERPQSPSRVA